MMKLIIQPLRKDNMETKFIMKLQLLIVFVSTWTFALAQSNYCYNQVGKSIDFPEKRMDSLYLEYDKMASSYYIKIVNPTKDTLYLFSSYFSQELQSSKYLHEVDKKNKTYYISFVPIISNLATKRTDKTILGEEKIAQKEQVLYDFIKLNPNTYYVLQINYSNLFKNRNTNKNAVKHYNHQSLSKFKKASFKTVTTSKLTGKYNLIFQFGIYTDVSILCSESDYYLNEFEFDKQAKSFKTINFPIILNNPNYLLFK